MRAKSALEAVDQQVDLHAAELGHVVVVIAHPGLELGRHVAVLGDREFLELLLGIAHERGVLVEQLGILAADLDAQLLEVLLDLVEDAGQQRLVLALAVELLEHLVGVADRRQRLVGAGIGHARPGVGALVDLDAELERAEAGPGLGLGLQVAGDLLVDGDALRPARRGVRAALDVAREQLDAGEQAAHAAHVAVAVALDLVADALEHQGLGLEGLERLQALLESRSRGALGIGPEGVRHHAVRAEHDHQALLAPRGVAEPEAGQVEQEGQGRGIPPEIAQEPAAADVVAHGWAAFCATAGASVALVTISARRVRMLQSCSEKKRSSRARSSEP